MNCNEIQDQLEEYALGTLPETERARIEQHLDDCPDRRRRTDALRETLNSLPEALSEASRHRVPPELKTKVLASIADSVTEPPASLDNERRQDKVTGTTTGRRRLPFGLRPRTLAGLAAVAVILLVLSLVWSVRLSIVLAEERALRAEYADLIGRQEIVLEVVDSEQTVRRVLLPPAGGGPTTPYSKLFTREDMSYLVAMAARLPRPPSGQAYHLWVQHDGTTELAGTLEINDDGFGLLVRKANREGPTYDSAYLTLQPEGSTAPTGEPVLVWEPSG